MIEHMDSACDCRVDGHHISCSCLLFVRVVGEILAAPGGLNSRQLFYSFRVRHVVSSHGSYATGVASKVMGLLPQDGVYSYGFIATGWRIPLWVYCHRMAYTVMSLLPRCGV